MNKIFIGGSRHVSRLPAEVKQRLDNVIASGHLVVVGDANGADKAVQKHLLDKRYDNVTVFCSGEAPRNNLGTWRTHHVDVPKSTKGFQFYAAKDREMAREADFGLMIWDGKSPGTILNVLRLALAGKIAVLFSLPDKNIFNIKTVDHWKAFISHCSREVQIDVKERATPEEWRVVEDEIQPNLFVTGEVAALSSARPRDDQGLTATPMIDGAVDLLNTALACGDATTIMEVLGSIARERGMSQIARETGLARESLYRALDANGNPEFANVLKVLFSLGLHLEAKKGAPPSRKLLSAPVAE